MTMLAPFVEPLAAGQPAEHEGLTLVPLSSPDGQHLDYRLAQEALDEGNLLVTEVSEGGSVPELRAENRSERLILLLDGEELVGAKQNRILNTSVLLAPKSETKIPVSCVEQGRWRYASPDFRPGSWSPSRLRARKSRDVTRSLRARQGHHSDQGAVWDEVQETAEALDAASPTMALHEAVTRHEGSITGYLAALPWPEGARGVFVAVAGRFAAIDLFDRPETLQKVWPRLVTGYAIDAMASRRRGTPQAEPKAPRVILGRLAALTCERRESPGVGEDWRMEAEELVGQALVAEGVCVHLSVFPNEDGAADAGRPESPISPPSRRRRRRGRGPEHPEL